MKKPDKSYARERDPITLIKRYKEKAESTPGSSRIILTKNSKVVKNTKEGFLTGTIHLAPSVESLPFGGVNMCAKASDGCKSACLKHAGLHAMPYNAVRRVALTLWFLKDKNSFYKRLDTEIQDLIKAAGKKDLTPAVRPNCLSDRRDLATWIHTNYPKVLCYDYTKLPKPWEALSHNYHLTFSRSETNQTECDEALKHGVNVAVVFDGQIPSSWRGVEVLDGDSNDINWISPDKTGVYVGLKLKGSNAAKERARSSGFAVRV
ncbi:MAG: hypothetical protein KDH96_01940 [Candidatus Riesia sp.]|nr:hypothetical protein [Candidatus Riesia sp.]